MNWYDRAWQHMHQVHQQALADELDAPIYCRTTGQRVGTCNCLRCSPPAPAPAQ